MSEWKEYKLGEIADVQTGPFGSQLHMSDYQNEGTPIITVEHLGDNRIIHNNLPLVGEEDKNRLKKYVLAEGDIVFSRVGSVDRRAYVSANEDGWMFSGRCLRVRPTQKVDAKFLSYYFGLEDFKETIRRIAVGATMPSINTTILSNVVVPLPPIDTQRRISAILSSLDDKIDLLHRENATLEQMAETLFRQWFVVEAKEEWEEGKLGDIVDVKSGFAFKSSSFVDFGLYRLITIKAVQDGYLTLENADYISEIPDNIKDYCLLKEGDILLSLTGNVGRCCLVDRERLLLNQRVALLCAKDNKNWAFVYTLFRMQSMKSKLEEMAKGTAQPNLSPIELSNMQFDIPPTKLLDGFSDAATPLLRKALSNNKQIQTLIQTRDGLLPRLMGGEVKI